jgi:hypothetical protein
LANGVTKEFLIDRYESFRGHNDLGWLFTDWEYLKEE